MRLFALRVVRIDAGRTAVSVQVFFAFSVGFKDTLKVPVGTLARYQAHVSSRRGVDGFYGATAMDDVFQEAISVLEATGNYRILRRLIPRSQVNESDGTPTMIGVVIDTETTGLDPKTDEIIELAMVPFTFSADGRIFEVLTAFQELRQPSRTIPIEITRITGIDDEMVIGKTIAPDDVAAFIDRAVIVIAHNAAFDRPFSEQLCNVFASKCWACSASEIDWRAEGSESTKLAWLLSERGLFYERHRALSDCMALIELLTVPLYDGEPALKTLLDAARKTTYRLWAQNAPFEHKDILKGRRYRWNPGDDGRPKSWYIDCDNTADELEWLRREIYHRDVTPRIDKLTAFTRFSEG